MGFPLGKRVYSELKSLPDYRGFLTFLTLMTRTLRTSQESGISLLMTNRRPGTGSLRDDEQCVHRPALINREHSAHHACRCSHRCAHWAGAGRRTVTVVHIGQEEPGVGGITLLCTPLSTHGKKNITVVHTSSHPREGNTTVVHTSSHPREERYHCCTHLFPEGSLGWSIPPLYASRVGRVGYTSRICLPGLLCR